MAYNKYGRYGRDEEKEIGKGIKIFRAFVAITAIGLIFFAFYLGVPRLLGPEQSKLSGGVNTPFKPFEFSAGGEIIGIDIHIGGLVADKLGKKWQTVDFPDFDSVMSTLAAGGIDLIISGMTVTPERAEIFDFSESYYDVDQAVLKLKANSKFKKSGGNLSAEDFTGLRIGYQGGTTSETWFEGKLFGKVSLAGNTSFPNHNIALQSLRLDTSDRIDVIIVDKPVADSLANDYPDLEIGGTIPTGEKYAVAVAKGDPKHLLPAINEVIREIKQNGELNRTIKKYSEVS